jgi:hypothetical protein
MRFVHKPLAFAAMLGALLLTDPAHGVVQSTCVAKKNRCMSKKAASLLKCEQKAEMPGASIEPGLTACRQKASTKFDGGPDPSRGCFERLESKTPNDCINFDDTAAAELVVDDCVADIVGAIDPAPVDQSACNVGKEKCAATTLKYLLKCHEKAQKPSPKPIEPALSECLQKARAKLDGGTVPTTGCIARLEARSPNDCRPPLANTAAIAAVVDSCAGAFVARVETTTTTTLPEFHCCDFQIFCDFCYPNDRACTVAALPLDDCIAVGGRPGAPGSVCNGATGTCDATAAPGWCCQSNAGGCFSGPGVPEVCGGIGSGFTLGQGVCRPAAGSQLGSCQ